MNKETLYLDTSIPGAYHDSEKPRRQRRTWEFWEKLPLYEVKTSQVTVVEISRIAAPEMRRKTLSLIFVPEIEIYQVLEEDNELADEYLEFGIFPSDERDDALHVAIATIRGLNYLVSWNHDHIVEENTKRYVYELNAVWGYETPSIVSPIHFLRR